MSGWLKLHRQLLNWEWYSCIKTTRVFIHLLLTASWKDARWQGVEIPRGSVFASPDTLAAATGLSRQQVRTVITRLKSTSEITTKSTSKGTLITLCNFDTYNGDDEEINQRSNQRFNLGLTSDQPASNQHLTTSEEGKKDKKGKRKEEYPPTPKGGSRRSATPSAVDLISCIPDEFPKSYRPFAEEWAHDKQSRNTKQRFQSDRAFLTSINRMLKYSRETVADAVEMAIAGGWQGWEQDNIKQGSKVQNIRDASAIVEGWSSPNPQPDLNELFDIKRIAREREEEATRIAGEEPELEPMGETSCF